MQSLVHPRLHAFSPTDATSILLQFKHLLPSHSHTRHHHRGRPLRGLLETTIHICSRGVIMCQSSLSLERVVERGVHVLTCVSSCTCVFSLVSIVLVVFLIRSLKSTHRTCGGIRWRVLIPDGECSFLARVPFGVPWHSFWSERLGASVERNVFVLREKLKVLIDAIHHLVVLDFGPPTGCRT